MLILWRARLLGFGGRSAPGSRLAELQRPRVEATKRSGNDERRVLHMLLKDGSRFPRYKVRWVPVSKLPGQKLPAATVSKTEFSPRTNNIQGHLLSGNTEYS